MGLAKRFCCLLGVLALPGSQAGDVQAGLAPESFDFDVMIRTQQLRDLGVSTRPLWATAAQDQANGSSVASESNITTDGVGLSLTVSQERLVGLVRGVPVKPMAGDGLVALNGMALLSWADVQEAATAAAQNRQGFKGVLPLTLAEGGQDGTQAGVLMGFLRVELVDSGTLTFRPQEPARRGALVKEVLAREEADAQAKALEDKARQDKAQKLREQQMEAERRRKLLEEAEELERVKRVQEAQQAHKEAETHAGLRKEGKPFLYVASFQKPGALGLTFDMTVRDKSVVMSVEPNSAAAAQKVQAGDVLVVVNEVNVTALPPQHALQALSRSTWPRWLTFSVPGTQSPSAAITATQAAQADGVSLNATLVIHWPEVLQGSYPLYLAPWSLPPNTTTTAPNINQPAPLPQGNSSIEIGANGTAAPFSLPTVVKKPPLCVMAGGEGNGSSVGTCVNAQALLPAGDSVGCAKYPEAWGSGGGGGWVALVRRGECTFVDKARRVQETGGVGVLVVNGKDTLAHMPAGQLFTEDVHTPTAMVGSEVGRLLLLASSWQPPPPPSNGQAEAQGPSGGGVWIELLPYAVPAPPAPPAPAPPPPQANKGRQKPVPRKRGLVEETPKVSSGPRMREEMEEGGRLLLQADKGYSEDFDFLSALFGPRTPRLTGQLIIPDPKYGCDARTYKTRIAGAIVAVERGGGCAFSDKALAAQAGGALGVIIMNNKPDEPLMRLMAAPEEADKVKLPVYMASDNFRMELLQLQRFGRADTLIASLSEEKQWAAYD